MATGAIADKAITMRVDGTTKEHQTILAKLAEVETDPNTTWLTRNEVFGSIREQFGYEV